MSTELLTLQQAVEEGYGAYSTLRLWIKKGELQAYKTGNRVKIRREDLESLLVPANSSTVDAIINELVSSAPTLTSEQRSRLASIVGGVNNE